MVWLFEVVSFFKRKSCQSMRLLLVVIVVLSVLLVDGVVLTDEVEMVLVV